MKRMRNSFKENSVLENLQQIVTLAAIPLIVLKNLPQILDGTKMAAAA